MGDVKRQGTKNITGRGPGGTVGPLSEERILEFNKVPLFPAEMIGVNNEGGNGKVGVKIKSGRNRSKSKQSTMCRRKENTIAFRKVETEWRGERRKQRGGCRVWLKASSFERRNCKMESRLKKARKKMSCEEGRSGKRIEGLDRGGNRKWHLLQKQAWIDGDTFVSTRTPDRASPQKG